MMKPQLSQSSLTLCTLFICGCVANDTTKTLITALENSPAWSDLEGEGDATKLLVACETIADYDTAKIRSAVQTLMRDRSGTTGDYISKISRLYVLNRFLFDVPEFISNDEYEVFGYWNSPTRGDIVNVLWPLSVDSDGSLALTGRHGAFFGPGYDALGEFDYFHKRFGRR